MEEHHTNRELARDYFSVVAQYCNKKRIDGFLKQKRLIENFEVDLLLYYKTHGNLRGLQIPGFTGGIAKRRLEISSLEKCWKMKE